MTTGQLGDARERFAEQGYVLLRGALPAKLYSDYGDAEIVEYRRLTNAMVEVHFGGAARRASQAVSRVCRAGIAQGTGKDRPAARLIADLAPAPLTLAQAAGNLNLPGSAAALAVANWCWRLIEEPALQWSRRYASSL